MQYPDAIWTSGLLAFVTSFVCCCGILFCAKRWLSLPDMLNDTRVSQAMHSTPTPRLGGFSVIMGFLLGLLFVTQHLPQNLLYAVFSGGIVFVFGLLEDLFRNISARLRLLAAFASAAAAISLTGYAVDRFDLPQTDWVFAVSGVAIGFTLIWSAGTCHSVNLIDGLNGLSSFVSMISLAAFLYIAYKANAPEIVILIVILMTSLFGFLLFNWPWGKIFLGDAGAYTIGHILAWIGIYLIAQYPAVSSISVLLVLFWPVADTLFSMIRRLILGKSVSRPDRLHFHHIFLRLLERMAPKRMPRNWLNSLTSLALIPFVSIPAVCGVMFWNSPIKALVCLLGFAALFMGSYSVIVDLLASRRVFIRK